MTEDTTGRGKDSVVVAGENAWITVNGVTYDRSKADLESQFSSWHYQSSGQPLAVGIGNGEDLRREQAELVAAIALGVAPPNAGDLLAAINERQLMTETVMGWRDGARLISDIYVDPAVTAAAIMGGGSAAWSIYQGASGAALLANLGQVIDGGLAVGGLLTSPDQRAQGFGTFDALGMANNATFGINGGILEVTPGGSQFLSRPSLTKLDDYMGGARVGFGIDIANLVLGEQVAMPRGAAGNSPLEVHVLEDRTPQAPATPPLPVAPPPMDLEPRDYAIPYLLPGSRSHETEEGYAPRIGGQIPAYEPYAYGPWPWDQTEASAPRATERVVWQDDSDYAERIGGDNTPFQNWEDDPGASYSGDFSSEPTGFTSEPATYEYTPSPWEPEDLGASYAIEYPPDPPTYYWEPVDEGASYAIEYPPEPAYAPSGYNWGNEDEYVSYSL